MSKKQQGRLDFDSRETGPGVRRTDPETSREAAANIEEKIRGLRLRFMQRLEELGGEATAQEVGNGYEPLRRRASDLHKDGVIEVIGTRRCKRTGSNAQLYRKTKSQ